MRECNCLLFWNLSFSITIAFISLAQNPTRPRSQCPKFTTIKLTTNLGPGLTMGCLVNDANLIQRPTSVVPLTMQSSSTMGPEIQTTTGLFQRSPSITINELLAILPLYSIYSQTNYIHTVSIRFVIQNDENQTYCFI